MPASHSYANIAPGLLSPSPSSARPRTTFPTLPRELRDKCYTMALRTPLPIVVWSGIRPFSFIEGFEKATEYRAATADVRTIFLNLIRCNGTIASEAAMVFYRKNRFFFSGDWTWETVVEWLVNIGPTNRASISQIELHTWSPAHAWEALDGHQYAIANAREPPFPLSPYLFDDAELLFTMDLPNVMKKLCEGMSDVEVLWSGTIYKSVFDDEEAEIETFWEIVAVQEENRAGTEGLPAAARFVLKRKHRAIVGRKTSLSGR
ncbi:hypothetical protein CJF31_00006772 [Rutstroemia sp. NJR-2017a BVV2]|nr:hypothetical protein CJF31_00006772 [Rutstroemia sp. NJR-2017a BVV2]